MLRDALETIALCAVAIFAMSCAISQAAAQNESAAAQMHPAARTAVPADPPADVHRDGNSDSGGLFREAQSPIGIDYSPQARCAEENADWLSGNPKTCNPPLSQDERTCGNSLNKCPGLCLKCYSDDLAFIKHNLNVNTITVYHPNYYVIKAAERLGMKVIVGVVNDTVLGLASPANNTNCYHVGKPLYLCGSRYADALIEGACIDTVGGDPFKRCASRCARRSDPARDCVNGDCSCWSDSDCPGAGNRCLSGANLRPLNNPATGEFLKNGTVISIQLGNEFLGACYLPEVPGQDQPCCNHSKKTGKCNAWTVTREVISAAAQTLRAGLDRHGFNQVKISVPMVARQGRKFCRNGEPPPGVDYIGDHPYCDFVAEMPPQWTTLSGAECWKQARREFAIDQKACGVSHTYIGETGFNSGCPSMENHGALLKAQEDFVKAMIRDEPVCQGKPNPTAPLPNFLFEFSDVGPATGCLGGCGDPHQCSFNCCCKNICSATEKCSASCPPCLGNGYFGLFHSANYGTRGGTPVPKFNPMPSLLCPDGTR